MVAAAMDERMGCSTFTYRPSLHEEKDERWLGVAVLDSGAEEAGIGTSSDLLTAFVPCLLGGVCLRPESARMLVNGTCRRLRTSFLSSHVQCLSMHARSV